MTEMRWRRRAATAPQATVVLEDVRVMQGLLQLVAVVLVVVVLLAARQAAEPVVVQRHCRPTTD